MPQFNWSKYLLVFIIVITLTKLLLVENGFMAFYDEYRYTQSGVFFEKLKEHHIKEAVYALFATDGRPGDAVIRTIPIVLQFITSKINHLYIAEPRNSYPLFLFNYIINCLILLIHFRFSKLVLKDVKLALLSVILLAVLTNSFLYLRHALAYEPSLLIFYYVLYRISKNIDNDGLKYISGFGLGMLVFFGYLTYPGYFILYLLIGLVFVFYKIDSSQIANRVKHVLLYGAGSAAMLLITELLSRFGGNSYLKSSLVLSSTITQGSFEESFSFLFKYLFEVEGISGVIIIALLVFFYLRAAATFNLKSISTQSLPVVISIAVTFLFLFYASAGYFLHKWVFYGRLLHQFFPFVCIICLITFKKLNVTTLPGKLVYGLLPIILAVSFAVNFINLKTFCYPRDIAWKYVNLGKQVTNYCEFKVIWCPINIRQPAGNVAGNKAGGYQSVLLTNGAVYYPLKSMAYFKPLVPKANYTLLESHPYWYTAKAYQYEGYNIAERKMLDEMNLKVSVYAVH